MIDEIAPKEAEELFAEPEAVPAYNVLQRTNAAACRVSSSATATEASCILADMVGLDL